MKAVVVERSVARFAAAKAASLFAGSGSSVGFGPLRLGELDELALSFSEVGTPHANLVRHLRIRSRHHRRRERTRYFESIVSFPFVLGHEIVGELDGPNGVERVVVEPVLGYAARAITPPCPACAIGEKGRCYNITLGNLRPGLQTGFCADTGGGWSEGLIVHESQVHQVPSDLTDEQAVLVEPAACALHAAYRSAVAAGERVVVLGAGTLGLLTIAALRSSFLPTAILAIAKYSHQRDLAADLGADVVAEPKELVRAVRRMTTTTATTEGTMKRLSGGADVVFDCVGSSSSLAQALSVVRPGGRVVLVGMPSTVRVDLAPMWQREVSILAAYAYGAESTPEGPRSTFDLAFELVREANLGRLVSAYYPLEDYEEAVRHAAHTGGRGAVKVVFDLRRHRRRPSDRSPSAEGQK